MDALVRAQRRLSQRRRCRQVFGAWWRLPLESAELQCLSVEREAIARKHRMELGRLKDQLADLNFRDQVNHNSPMSVAVRLRSTCRPLSWLAYIVLVHCVAARAGRGRVQGVVTICGRAVVPAPQRARQSVEHFPRACGQTSLAQSSARIRQRVVYRQCGKCTRPSTRRVISSGSEA